MTFGFSRDDSGKFLKVYQEKRILDARPVPSIDTVGVGYLVEQAVQAGRKSRPDLKLRRVRRARRRPVVDSLLPEGRPELRQRSPYRVAVARLAAAQAALSVKVGDWTGLRLARLERLRSLDAPGMASASRCRGPRALSAIDSTNGQDPPPLAGTRQSDRRRRGRRAARLRRQGTGRERASTRPRRASPSRVSWAARSSCGSRTTGIGMAPEDARLALERHATSKIATVRRPRRDHDARVPRRGAAEHRVGVAAGAADAARGRASGTEIRVNGGTMSSVREVGRADGTSVEVADLFYNLPARRKFLKSDAAESAQISRMVTQFALAYPEVGFTLASAGRKVLECPPVRTLPERFYQLYGDREDLVEVGKEASGIRVFGLVAALAEQGPKRGPAEHLREPAHRQGQDDCPRRHRGVQRRRRSRSAARRSTCSSRCRRTRWTSTSIRRRPRSGSATSRACTRSCGARWAPRSARGRRRNCSCGRRRDPGAPADVPVVSRPAAAAFIRAAGRPCRAGRRRCPAPDGPQAFASPGAGVRHRGRGAAGRAPARRPGRRARRPADDPARPVPRHVHHRGRRRGDCDHRPARGARARAVRAGHAAARPRAGWRASGCSSRWWWSCRLAAARCCCGAAAELERFGFEVEEFGGEQRPAWPRCRRC